MTSKESLNNIKNLFIGSPINPTQQFEIIEKDLEILEIVKTHKLLNYVIKNEKCAKMYNLTEKEINKLKEWLSNE